MAEVEAKAVITAVDQATPLLQRIADGMDQLVQRSGQAKQGFGEFNAMSIISIATGVSLSNALNQAVGAFRNIAVGAVEAADNLQALDNRAQVIYGAAFPRMAAQADA